MAIVGSRDFPARELVEAFVASLPADAVVVSGGARGVDMWAEEAAKARGLQTDILEADWAGQGRRAGPIRNAEIVARADRLAAFWNGRSRGTLNSVLLARRRGIPVEIIGTDGVAVPIEAAIEFAERAGVVAALEAGVR